MRWYRKLASLDSPVVRDLLANLFQQAVGGGIQNTEGLNCNPLEKITTAEICVFLLLA